MDQNKNISLKIDWVEEGDSKRLVLSSGKEKTPVAEILFLLTTALKYTLKKNSNSYKTTLFLEGFKKYLEEDEFTEKMSDQLTYEQSLRDITMLLEIDNFLKDYSISKQGETKGMVEEIKKFIFSKIKNK